MSIALTTPPLSIPAGMAVCPKCNGTKHQAVDATGKPIDQATDYPRWPQYAERGWMECRNCGGQSMSQTARGFTSINPATGLGCLHQFRGENAGRCYTVYTCTLGCGARYDIDSSD
jgi:monoamine oxidase